jgi:hypothetical protein
VCGASGIGGGSVGGISVNGNTPCRDNLFGLSNSTEATVDTDVIDPARPLCSGDPIEVPVGVGLAGGGVALSSWKEVRTPKFPATLEFPLLCLYITASSLEAFGPCDTEGFLCGGGCRGDRESSDIIGSRLILVSV